MSVAGEGDSQHERSMEVFRRIFELMSAYYQWERDDEVTYSTLIRSGASELDVADYQRSQLAVLYLVLFPSPSHVVCVYGACAGQLPQRSSDAPTPAGVQLQCGF